MVGRPAKKEPEHQPRGQIEEARAELPLQLRQFHLDHFSPHTFHYCSALIEWQLYRSPEPQVLIRYPQREGTTWA